MASSIDETKPVSGSPTTLSVRDNFSAAKSEIEALQTDLSAAESDIVTLQGKTNDASTSNKGIVELATSSEAISGASNTLAITPSSGSAAYMPRKAEMQLTLSDHTISSSENGTHFYTSTAGTRTITIPTTLDIGFTFYYTNQSTGTLKFTSADNLNGSSADVNMTNAWTRVVVIQIATGSWIINEG